MTVTAFPAGMCSPLQIESASLEALAPDVAGYIENEDAQNLQGLLDFYDIPPDLQPEAVRQLAFGYGLSDPPNWRYDSAKVERVADQLVRRTPDQQAAREEILAQFSLLNGARPADAFDEANLHAILPRLAPDDQRRAVLAISNVMVHEEDDRVLSRALDALERNARYLKPRDYMDVVQNILGIFALSHTDNIRLVSLMAANVLTAFFDHLLTKLESAELLELAHVAQRIAERIDRYSVEFDCLCSASGMLTAIVSGRDEGVTRLRQEQCDRLKVMERAIKAMTSNRAACTPVETGSIALKKANLEFAGFRQLGGSRYFERNGFLVHVGEDGQTEVFTSGPHNLRLHKAEGFRSDKDELKILYRAGKKIDGGRRWIPVHEIGSIRAIRDERTGPERELSFDFVKYARAIPIERQLLDSGFQEDPGTNGIFRGKFGTDEAIVCVYGGEVWFVGLSLDIRHRRYQSVDTEFAADLGDGFKMRRGSAEVSVGRLGVEGIRLIGPIEDVPGDIVGQAEEAFDDPSTGFMYGGVNPTERIRSLRTLNGYPIATIEEAMPEGSGPLIEVMANNNDWVLSHGLTHQQLAQDLNYARWVSANTEAVEDSNPERYFQRRGAGDFYDQEIANTEFGNLGDVHEFVLYGQRFITITSDRHVAQGSPFRDGLRGSRKIMVVNMDARKLVVFDEILSDLIGRYGVYNEIPPQQIAEVFGLIP